MKFPQQYDQPHGTWVYNSGHIFLLLWYRDLKLAWNKLHCTYSMFNPYPATWKIRWAPNNDSKWQMEFNSVFKGLNDVSSVQCWGGLTLWQTWCLSPLLFAISQALFRLQTFLELFWYLLLSSSSCCSETFIWLLAELLNSLSLPVTLFSREAGCLHLPVTELIVTATVLFELSWIWNTWCTKFIHIHDLCSWHIVYVCNFSSRRQLLNTWPLWLLPLINWWYDSKTFLWSMFYLICSVCKTSKFVDTLL
jgi:hypothetical protein